MPWAEFLILDGAILIAALIYYRNRPKPKWLATELNLMKWIAKAIGIIKRVDFMKIL